MILPCLRASARHGGARRFLVFFGSVEILEGKKESLLGAPAHRAFAPAARVSPKIAITRRRLMRIF